MKLTTATVLLTGSLTAGTAAAQCEPTIVGSVDTAQLAFSIDADNGLAAVVDQNILRIVDATDPTNPVITGSLNLPSQAWDVEVRGTLAYLACGSSGLQIVDFATPGAPAIIGALDTNGTSNGVNVAGTLAFIADGFGGDGLVIFDVTDPTNPTALGNLLLPGNAQEVWIEGNLAYVASGGLFIADITDPTNPLQLGSVTTGFAISIAKTNNVVYLAEFFGVRAYDVTDANDPVELSYLPTSDFITAIDAAGDLVYVANDDTLGLRVFDYSDPAAPAVIGAVLTGDLTVGVSLADGLVYVSDFTGVKVIDASSCSSGQPGTYCAGKANSQGCTPTMTTNGLPSIANGAPFMLDATDVINMKNGLMFYSYGPLSLPWQGGTLCVSPPLRRLPIQNSGGTMLPTEDCSGVLSVDFNAHLATGLDPFLTLGQRVNAAWWFRDPNQADGTGVGLSDAVQFYVGS